MTDSSRSFALSVRKFRPCAKRFTSYVAYQPPKALRKRSHPINRAGKTARLLPVLMTFLNDLRSAIEPSLIRLLATGRDPTDT
tara:strand:+ start:894 stop:1142 length:249 start_codon:yes stop_codon:yes gene_type:complete